MHILISLPLKSTGPTRQVNEEPCQRRIRRPSACHYWHVLCAIQNPDIKVKASPAQIQLGSFAGDLSGPRDRHSSSVLCITQAA